MNTQLHAFIARFKSLFSSGRKVAIVLSAIVVLGLLTMVSAHKPQMSAHLTKQVPEVESFQTEPPTSLTGPIGGAKLKEMQENDSAAMHFDATSSQATRMFSDQRREQAIAYCADLGVITKDFQQSRSYMEEILDRHRGYAARL